jgi:hypothetical protein
MTTYGEIKQKHENAYNKIMEDSGVFWAFSNEQFKEGIEKIKASGKINPGEKVARIPAGGFVPSKNADAMIKLLKEANDIKKKELKAAKDAKESAILYELNNHECFYNGNNLDTVAEIFEDIYTMDDIKKVFKKHNNN